MDRMEGGERVERGMNTDRWGQAGREGGREGEREGERVREGRMGS